VDAGLRRLAGALLGLVACKQSGTPTAPLDGASPTPSGAVPAGDASVVTKWSKLDPVGSCDLAVTGASPSGLVWKACSGGPRPPDCSELTTTLSTSPFGTLRAVGAATSSGTMLFVRIAGLADHHERYVLGPPDGPARLMLDASCAGGHGTQPGSFAVSGDGALLSFDSLGDRAFFAGPFSDDPVWHAPAAHLTQSALGEAILNEPLTVSGRSIRAVDARQRVLRSSPTAGSFSAQAAGPLFRGSLDHAVARGDVTVFRVETIPEAFGIQVGDTAPALWFQPAAGQGVSAPAIDASELYWLQGKGRDRNNGFSSIEVFSAPFPTSSSPPSPRRIASTATTILSEPTAGAGHVAYEVLVDPDRRAAVDILEVATSRTVRFEPPASKTVARIVYVDAKEVAVEVTDARERSMTSPMWTWRITLAGLPSAP
jgi:hypothetical protein